jgi:hypothetical protein
MLYRSAPLDRTGGARRTKLTFRNVLDFRFREHELGLSWTDLDSSKFGLIEIEASELLAQFVAAGRVRSRSSGSIKEADLRHYRIVFDDHGRYDIVCTNLQIETII